jgi:hypothetical protein
MREQIAAAARDPVVVLIENYADTNCSCFDFDDLPKLPNKALGWIINGAIRNAEEFSDYHVCVRARGSHPRPFCPMPPILDAQEKRERDSTRIYVDDVTYAIGDLDSLLTFFDPEIVFLANEVWSSDVT